MIQGDMNIRAAIVIETIKSNKPEMLNRYTETQLVLRVRTEKRAYNRRNKKFSKYPMLFPIDCPSPFRVKNPVK